jgi:hypothetical protein
MNLKLLEQSFALFQNRILTPARVYKDLDIEGKKINILANVCEESELMDPSSCHLLLVYGKKTSF